MWNDDAVDLWKNWEAITVKQVYYWQVTLNKHCLIGSRDRITFEWAFSKLKASCTSDFREQIKIKFETLAVSFKGAVTHTFYLLRCLFNQSRDTTASLKSYIALFKTQGSQKKNLKGENVVLAKKECLLFASV